ncbi:MAG TPA: segregation/condensation protein A [Clostridiaceae bacterium]|nr:segregation/condensation protein A [Clostridiaceae bacterium]
MNQFLTIQIAEYESPLDLIYRLIEVNQVDIYNIPIADITEQYISVLEHNSLTELDMELASEFLVMATTLMQIKSGMLLPDVKSDLINEDFSDPREELVLRLLAYRRNKQLALELEKNYSVNQGSYLKMASSTISLGLSIEIVEDKISSEKFVQAVESLTRRNKLRFGDQNKKIRQLLRREKFSVKDKMLEIVKKVFLKSRMFFNELFPVAKTSKAERVSGFLAILELIRQDKLKVKQSGPFAVMMIELEPELKNEIKNGSADLIQDLMNEGGELIEK